MKSRFLTVFLFLATLLWGGASLAHVASDEPCPSHRADAAAVAFSFDAGLQQGVSPSLPAKHHGPMTPDCCAGIGGCRMLTCQQAIAILPVLLEPSAPDSFHGLPIEAARLDGRNVPPVLGPPRTLSSAT